ncbi:MULTISPECIES: right-handed parallel beta-helix repeat-containing protein [unclassified Haladaptatus]|uniref:right-handed parallel beta-helix repeat-containing protein n=1 Tax=unclassified Haladaptatus TaxID=2622732 RepID=UPI0023E7DEA4|nr:MULTISPECIES: right-handed parallel beta-helix repeat-containing protein [unclassified Haladaptatus]
MSERTIGAKVTITKPGRYTLASDIQNGGGTHLSEACIRIEADDVVLDGRGFTLAGRGVSDTTGIVAADVQNVTIHNLTVSGWDYGIRFENVRGGVVRNARLVDTGYGISFVNTESVRVRDSHIVQNVLGVMMDAPSNVSLEDNRFESNAGRDVYRVARRG